MTPFGPSSLFNFQCFFNLFISSLYMYSISLFYSHLIMTFWKRRNVLLCFTIFYHRFLLLVAYCQMFYQIFTYSHFLYPGKKDQSVCQQRVDRQGISTSLVCYKCACLLMGPAEMVWCNTNNLILKFIFSG